MSGAQHRLGDCKTPVVYQGSWPGLAKVEALRCQEAKDIRATRPTRVAKTLTSRANRAINGLGQQLREFLVALVVNRL